MRSHLTLDQRREKLKSLKAKSKCMRCGALGHWAGDPECKFPTSQSGKGKAGNESAAAFVVRANSAAAKPIAAPAREPREMVMEGGDKKFYLGQHRNETYSEVGKKVEFIQWLMARVTGPCRTRTSLLGSIGTTLSEMEVCKLGHP